MKLQNEHINNNFGVPTYYTYSQLVENISKYTKGYISLRTIEVFFFFKIDEF